MFDGEVSREGGLASFFADDTDTDVGGLDHGHVVAAVADAADTLLGELADKACHVSLLGGGTAAGNDGGELDGDGDEFVAVVGQH